MTCRIVCFNCIEVMGSCQSSTKAPPPPPNPPRRTFDDELNDSLHGKHRTTRQKMARHNEDIHINEVYKIVSILGQGSMGEVTLIEKKVASKGRRYACKTVSTLRMNKSELMEFLNEIDILRDLDHPNIVQLFEVYHQKRKIWIVTELCLGGDLWTRANENTEGDVVDILSQITRAVTYMHKRNVCHRDIKMENILYSDTSPTATVKLIDFGISNKFTKGVKMLNACGTVYTAAPETLLRTGSTHSTDIWSIGVVAFILLSQEYPFLKDYDDLKNASKVQRLENAELSFGPEWENRNISPTAKQFVSLCLQKDFLQRCSASEALHFTQTKWLPYLEHSMIMKDNKNLDQQPSPLLNDSIQSDVSNVSPHDDSLLSHLNASPRSSPSKKIKRKISSSMLHGMAKFGQYGELKKTILMTISYAMDKSR